MFVNKIGNGLNHQQVFKGYQHEVDEVGQKVMRFNYPFDYENEQYFVEFYNVKRSVNNFSGYEVIGSQNVGRYPIGKEGVEVKLEDMAELKSDGVFAYRIVKGDGNKFADTGMNVNGFTLVTGQGTTPMVQGPGVLSMADLHRPGAYYDKLTGVAHYDINRQKASEGIIRNFANAMGGNLAGYEYELDDLNNPNGKHVLKDVKVFFSTPVGGGDNRSAFRYWNKNNMQIDPGMGTTENYANFIKKLFQHGKKFVYDGTFTSEGLEGIHFQYAVRWADQNPQTHYWFRMTGIKDAPLSYGVIPKHAENLRHKIINAPSLYDPESGKVYENPDYVPNKETYIQIYDALQASKEQAEDLTKPMGAYANPAAQHNPLAINSHDDTIINFVFEVNPQEYTRRLEALSEHNKNNEAPIILNSLEGTKFIGQFSNFKLGEKKDGGVVTWDANTDMIKMNYHISGYDEKILKAIVSPSQRDYETMLTNRGTYEVQDLALQAARYWTAKSKNIQTLYTAQTLQSAATQDAIKTLIANKKLPDEAALSEDAITNIINNEYEFEPKGVEDKDDVTVKALMSLPLDSLEFAENTAGVLSTSFFSNRATNSDLIGLSRFELMQKGEPHLVEPYASNYLKMNNLYKNELKNFADQIIKKVDEGSSEKLLDENGNYTTYGEYVIELMGQDIAKYALLKAIGGKNTEAWTFADGTITYDYDKIRENTTIKQLVTAHSPADEASELRKLMAKGLRNLSTEDVDFVAKSISQRIAGTNTNSFRLAEAIVAKASLGLDWRLDAAKDVIDWDSVRNGYDLDFDTAWDQVIDFWAKFVKAVKKENPNAYIVAEITDIENLMRDIYGHNDKLNLYKDIHVGSKYKSVKDAMAQFYLNTGVTSEAGYSYTFTNLLKVFSADFENGRTGSMQKFMEDFYDLLNTRSSDYIRNLWTFADNHDKPSVMHGMALDMGLFLANLKENADARKTIMQILMNADNMQSMPLEARLNINNMNYFNTASTKAAAMSKLMLDCIQKLDNETATQEEIKFLKEAVTDLTNGNYLGEGSNFELAIKTPALSNLRDALTEMLTTADIYLESDKFEAILKEAENRVDKYAINGTSNNPVNAERIELMIRGENNEKPSGETNLEKYSIYSASIACILREAFHAALPEVDELTGKKFWNAQKDFVKKYDRKFIEAQQASLPAEESSAISMKKNGYASRDFETVIKMIIKQAEYKAHLDGKLEEGAHFQHPDEILKKMFKDSTEPAVNKAVIYASFLSALPGIPTLFLRDMLGALGFDERAKNVYLQNRNAITWSELEEGPLKEYRTIILKKFKDTLELRTLAGEGLNQGTPYYAETSEKDIPAILMQDGHGNATVSLFNTTGISHDNRHNPELTERKVQHILLGAGLALPIGTVFTNVLDKSDTAKYIVQKIGDRIGIKNSNGCEIALNKFTARNGAMILRTFKGRPRTFNKQYNIVSNPYKRDEAPLEGQALSIIAG